MWFGIILEDARTLGRAADQTRFGVRDLLGGLWEGNFEGLGRMGFMGVETIGGLAGGGKWRGLGRMSIWGRWGFSGQE